MEAAFAHPVTIITGGPGTGKSTTLISLAKALPNAVVIAPTGKAVERLKPLEAMTIHRLLSRYEVIPHDAIIVDESSMVDLPLMARLASCAKRDARFVFVGDPDQLSPIGLGQPFLDLIDRYPTTRLTRVMRSERPEILDLADAVRVGDVARVMSHCKASIDLSPDGYLTDSPQEALREQQRAVALSPVTTGPMGCEGINEAMLLRLQRKRRPFFTPIIILENDERSGLFNGQLGVIQNEQAYFPGAQYSIWDLPKHDLAFCLTVHKSQGSEFDEVYLYLPESKGLNKQLLYTAVTRAKKRVHICASEEAVRVSLATSPASSTSSAASPCSAGCSPA